MLKLTPESPGSKWHLNVSPVSQVTVPVDVEKLLWRDYEDITVFQRCFMLFGSDVI